MSSHIYWSRLHLSRRKDVIFDENIFPFSELHANAGARLRSEINLLHPTLLNPGGENVADQYTNAANSFSTSFDDNSGSDEGEDAAHEILVPVFPIGSTTFEADRTSVSEPAPQQTGGASTSGSGLTNQAPAAASPVRDSGGGSGAQQHEPVTQQQGSATTPAGSSTPSDEHIMEQPQATEQTQATVQEQRPHTRLQSGIRKKKVYTDGTVRYSFLTTSGEPWSTEEALSDNNWKKAMDVEYGALMHNKTWHLVPPQKGRNVIGCK